MPEQTMVLQVLMATMAYFLCGILRKERGEKRKKKMSWPRKKIQALALFPFCLPFLMQIRPLFPPPFILALPVRTGREDSSPSWRGTPRDGPRSHGAHTRLRTHTQTSPGATVRELSAPDPGAGGGVGTQCPSVHPSLPAQSR